MLTHLFPIFQAANSTVGGHAACCCRHNPLSRPKFLLVCVCLYLTCCSDCAHAAWSHQRCCQELLVPAQEALWQDTRVRTTAQHTTAHHNTAAPSAVPRRLMHSHWQVLAPCSRSSHSTATLGRPGSMLPWLCLCLNKLVPYCRKQNNV